MRKILFWMMSSAIAFYSCKKDDESGNAANNNSSNNTPTNATAHSCGDVNVHNAAVSYSSMTDQDGKTYKTVIIDGNEWMAENLKTTKYRNGDAILTGLTSDEWWEPAGGAWCYYNNNSTYDCPYGKLYNWGVVEDTRKICPTGWHVPTVSEWNELFSSQGGESVAGNALTSTGDSYWFSGNESATNTAGFSAIPGGYRDGTGMLGSILMDFNANFWTSTEAPPFYVNAVVFDGSGDIDFRETHAQDGVSIRCKRD
jgi:uncharacterized protein (TIGR02145 family)